jgi:hypothetical protein
MKLGQKFICVPRSENLQREIDSMQKRWTLKTASGLFQDGD